MKPLVCDLCNEQWDGESPAWTYHTPNTAPSAEEAEDGLFWAEDPYWLVCMECHRLVTAENKPGLLARSLLKQSVIVLGDDGDGLAQMIQERIAHVHYMFWHNKSIEPPRPEPSMPVQIVEP